MSRSPPAAGSTGRWWPGTVEIAGTVAGKAEAFSVTIRAGAEVLGSVVHHEIEVERGAKIDGPMPWRPKGYIRRRPAAAGDRQGIAAARLTMPMALPGAPDEVVPFGGRGGSAVGATSQSSVGEGRTLVGGGVAKAAGFIRRKRLFLAI